MLIENSWEQSKNYDMETFGDNVDSKQLETDKKNYGLETVGNNVDGKQLGTGYIW
jgi:hypothetical protein